MMTLVKVNSWNWYNLNKLQLHPDEPLQHSEKIAELRQCRDVIPWLSWKTAPVMVMDIKVSLLLLSPWPLLTHCCIKQEGNVIFTLQMSFYYSGTWRISAQKSTIQDESARRTNLFLINWLAHTYWILNEFMVPSLIGLFYLPSFTELFYLEAQNCSFWEKCCSFFTLLSQNTHIGFGGCCTILPSAVIPSCLFKETSCWLFWIYHITLSVLAKA